MLEPLYRVTCGVGKPLKAAQFKVTDLFKHKVSFRGNVLSSVGRSTSTKIKKYKYKHDK